MSIDPPPHPEPTAPNPDLPLDPPSEPVTPVPDEPLPGIEDGSEALGDETFGLPA